MIATVQISYPSRTAMVLRQTKLRLSGGPKFIKRQHIRMCNSTCAERGVVPASGGEDRRYLLIRARGVKVQQPTDGKYHGTFGFVWGMILSKVCCGTTILLLAILQFYITLTLSLQLQGLPGDSKHRWPRSISCHQRKTLRRRSAMIT